MSVQPYTSQDAPPQDNGGGGSSGGSAIPSNSPVPDLAMVWLTAPQYVAQISSGSGPKSTVTGAPDLSIDLGSLNLAENEMLAASSIIVHAYQALKQQFQSEMDTVFGQSAQETTESETASGSGAGSTNWTTTTSSDDVIQPMAAAFANGQNGQPGMNAVQEFGLQQIGNAMALVGEFIALMNASGNSYATTDANSVVPTDTGSSS
jgi:hypothetical protein